MHCPSFINGPGHTLCGTDQCSYFSLLSVIFFWRVVLLFFSLFSFGVCGGGLGRGLNLKYRIV